MQEPQYIGSLKVIGLVPDELKTVSGGEVFKVMFEGGQSQLMTKKAFYLLVTNAQSDATNLQERKFKLMLEELLTVVNDYDVTGEEVTKVGLDLSNELMNSYNRALHFLLKKDDTTFNPSVGNPIMTTSLLDVDKILKTIPPRNL